MVKTEKATKVFFMGSPDFAVASLKAVIEAGFQVVGVATQPDKKKGRSKVPLPTPVKEYAASKGITVYEPKSLKVPEFIDSLRSLKPDVIVVVAYGKILPKLVLQVAPLGCVNVHGSLLPALRGAAPVNWAIINGDSVAGVSTMLLDEGMDTGPVFLTKSTPIGTGETAGVLMVRLSQLGAELLVETLKQLVAGDITATAQDDTLATYAPILSKKDGRIDWTLSAEEVARKVLGLSPWPGTYTALSGKKLSIHKARALKGNGNGSKAVGSIVECEGECEDALAVICGEGLLKIEALQLEGKRRMDTAEFLRGYGVEKILGEVLS